MAKTNLGIPQGMRDFGPDVLRKRQFIVDVIKRTFELYGFQPLETPAIELLSVLEGKYGDEGNKLMYKIRSNESLRANNAAIDEAMNNIGYKYWIPKASDKALRYDLTIPFARYVAMNHSKLTFPFKRYQIQPVWRADRPQKGRYREFYQCDADIVGSTSLVNEIELTNIYADVFQKLEIEVTIKVNNRKILSGIAESIGAPNKMVDIAIAIDKYDKIGNEGVRQELFSKGFDNEQVKKIDELILMHSNKINYGDLAQKGDNNLNQLNFLKNGSDIRNSKNLQTGVQELEALIKTLNSTGFNDKKIEFDLTLARGLNYYTGIIFEVKAKDVQMGSIGGGGRYDDLTGSFGVPDVPGVGISFGLDRIYDVMEELGKLRGKFKSTVLILFFNTGDEETNVCFQLMRELREKEIGCELYHEKAKFDKQFRYAEKKGIPYVVIIGSKELEEKTCVIKDIRKGEQQTIPSKQLAEFSFL